MRRLAGLDTLRGIAAICVLGYHFPAFCGFGLLGKGYLAVDFFFCLSGYVMARTYGQRLLAGEGGAFLRVRTWRLWPTMAVAGLLALPLFWLTQGSQAWWLALLNLMLIPTLVGRPSFALNGVAWSVFFELFANAAHVAVAKLDRATIFASAAILWFITAAYAQRAGSLDLGPWSATFIGGFPRVLSSYFLGIALYRTWGDRPPIHIPTIVTIAILPAAWLLLPQGALYDSAFVAIGCPLLIAGGLSLGGEPVGQTLGRLSFPLYAVHVPILQISVAMHLSWPVMICAVFAGAVAASRLPQVLNAGAFRLIRDRIESGQPN
jgi:peptidoglycan/LPS O-acetylase OafA/YrhL